jgi:hypothetical protein
MFLFIFETLAKAYQAYCSRPGVFAPECICSLYLKYIFNLFENVKKFEQKYCVCTSSCPAYP